MQYLNACHPSNLFVHVISDIPGGDSGSRGVPGIRGGSPKRKHSERCQTGSTRNPGLDCEGDSDLHLVHRRERAVSATRQEKCEKLN